MPLAIASIRDAGMKSTCYWAAASACTANWLAGGRENASVSQPGRRGTRTSSLLVFWTKDEKASAE